jgi:hypothetical protein
MGKQGQRTGRPISPETFGVSLSHILQNATPGECCTPLSCTNRECPRSGETHARVRLAGTLKTQWRATVVEGMFWNVGRVAGKPSKGLCSSLITFFRCLIYLFMKVSRKAKQSKGEGLSSLPRPHLLWKDKPKDHQMTRELRTIKTLRACLHLEYCSILLSATRWRQSTTV